MAIEQPDLSKFTLYYHGGVADRGLMNLYDASRSYYGFSRVLAVLGHYYSTGKIISQAPNADIELYIGISEEGTFRQNVYAGIVGAIIAAPFTTFIDYTIRSWLPPNDSDVKKIVQLLEEQNKLLKAGGHASDGEAVVKSHVENHKAEVDVMRSITSNSFREIFRPVGKSVEHVGILAGAHENPVGVVDEQMLALIEADRPDPETSVIEGVVNSFSRNSKTGVMFSSRMGRGFRFQYVGETALPRGDIFSWSQYYGRRIQAEGRFVRFFDGTIKRLEIYRAEKFDPDDEQ
jgi:hypothetical protein